MKELIQKTSSMNKALIFGRLSKVGSGVHFLYKVFFKIRKKQTSYIKQFYPLSKGQ
ncbi:hypothetical protein [Pseudoalteromonas sp. BSi20495]|uniref:hypothetical protein n=1 Tax=Pseudoalteromonas sp. BSi20495 TaxID=386429 RepID=UPI0013053EBC|nr:hypothetical protein [Pseudoalteromonas sp. BSi20495]